MQKGICVVESGSVSCFMEKGGEFNTALPFQVNNILDEINILDELQFVQLQDLNCIFDIELLDVVNV